MYEEDQLHVTAWADQSLWIPESSQHDFLVKIVVKVLMKTLLAWWFNYDWIAPVCGGMYNKKDFAFMLQHKWCLDKVLVSNDHIKRKFLLF